MSAASPSNCPWGKIAASPPISSSLSEVMSEEYAIQLQKDEQSELLSQYLTSDDTSAEFLDKISAEAEEVANETSNDLLLAQMLQLEFNKENDMHIKAMEKNYNGTSKVSMSFKNFQSLHPYEEDYYHGDEYNDDNDDEYNDDNDDEQEEEVYRKPAYKGEIITKHDEQNCERRNTRNVERFPMSFKSGDVGDIRLPNKVYNNLKSHSIKEERGGMRIKDKKERATHEQALDESTRLLIYKMVNNETLDSLNGIVSTGKEAVVFHANGGSDEDRKLPSECALKVFKTTLNEFKTRHRYIKDDHRFKERFTKQNPRKIVRLWAEKEFRNLTRMCEAGIRCPTPVLLRKHILVMGFIGERQTPAPKLKDAVLTKSQIRTAYQEIVEMMRTMYTTCNLIHADLSEYNILWFDHHCHVIDVSQSVEPNHPHAFHFLLRDCRNVTDFFSKQQVTIEKMMTAAELFRYVSGKEVTNIDEVEKEYQLLFEKDLELVTYGVEDSKFDYHFEQISQPLTDAPSQNTDGTSQNTDKTSENTDATSENPEVTLQKSDETSKNNEVPSIMQTVE